MALLIIEKLDKQRRVTSTEACRGTVENLTGLAATALVRYVPKGVTAKARYAETGARVAASSGAYSLPGIRVTIQEED